VTLVAKGIVEWRSGHARHKHVRAGH
jgi:hypothetical protein